MNQILREKKMRKLRRDSSFQKCRQSPKEELVGGEKVEILEHLENLLI
jgi:hypothetical protein